MKTRAVQHGHIHPRKNKGKRGLVHVIVYRGVDGKQRSETIRTPDRRMAERVLLDRLREACPLAKVEELALHVGQRTSFRNDPTYVSFHAARQRCQDPKHVGYRNYGGRGIEFRFTSFEQFLLELGLRPHGLTLDRINVNGHYEVGNCRWATWKEQGENRRKKRAAA